MKITMTMDPGIPPNGRTEEGDKSVEVSDALPKARDYLLLQQKEEGYWAGELEADASVTAGYIPIMHFLGRKIEPDRMEKILNHVMQTQNEDGSWSAYHNGPGDLNVSIQCYFALKVAGISARETSMIKSCDFILEKGGIEKANTITLMWLAVFGQVGWENTPSVPPELMLLPSWFPFNIYDFASWSRATIVALMVLSARRPVFPAPPGAEISELWTGEGRKAIRDKKRLTFQGRFYLAVDRLLKVYETFRLKPFRKRALRRAEEWIVSRQEKDGSWGGIMLPWVYSLFALRALGYGFGHPVMRKGADGLEEFIVEDDDSARLQPAVSPVWDTAWAVIALRESGLPPEHPALVKAARWLLSKQITVQGDWMVKNPRTSPGCWAFEFENNYYPDMDDTAVAARALLKIKLPKEEEDAKLEAVENALSWCIDM